MKTITYIAIYTLAISVFFTTSSMAENEKIYLSGSTTVTSNLIIPYKDELEEMTKLDMAVSSVGSGKGLKALLDGSTEVAMISANLNTILDKIERKEEAKDLYTYKIGVTEAVFAVHVNNPIKDLSDDQIRQILLGHVRSWKHFSGPDEEILVVTEYKGGGFRSMIEREFLHGQVIKAPNISEQTNGFRVVRKAAGHPNSFVVVTKNLLNSPKLSKISTEQKIMQPLILVTKGRPSEKVKAFIEAARKVMEYK